MTTPPLSILILAAGKGTRMKSDKAKVLHEVFFAPMVHHVVNVVHPLPATRTVVIVGHQSEFVKNALKTFAVEFVFQEQQLGTGHAVLSAKDAIPEENSQVMILCGDTPLMRTSTLEQMYQYHIRKQAPLTLMTTFLEDPTNYGRILSNAEGKIIGIVEQKDASPLELQINEINAGVYCVQKEFLFSAIQRLDTNNAQAEMYLTDIVKLAVEQGLNVEKFTTHSPNEVLGVNSRIEMADAHKELQRRRNHDLMLQGVTMLRPESITVAPKVTIASDTTIEPGVQITGNSQLGQSCLIRQGAILNNCVLGNNVTVGPYSCLNDKDISSGSILPPFSTN